MNEDQTEEQKYMRKCYPLTNNLYLAITENGIGIFTTRGQIHLTCAFGSDDVHVSKNLIAVFEDLYTPEGHPTLESIVEQLQNRTN